MTLEENLGNNGCSGLLLHNPCAAFDTTGHQIVLHTLSEHVGLSGFVFNWFSCYFGKRKCFESIHEHMLSQQYAVACGVPQGSMLGLLLFNLYALSVTE